MIVYYGAIYGAITMYVNVKQYALQQKFSEVSVGLCKAGLEKNLGFLDFFL